MERTRIKVIGDVQGVFFRFSAKIVADKSSITGWAQNESDGSVTILAEGSKKALGEFIEWCKEGSPMAEVQDVQTKKEDYSGEFKKFEVR